jgi:hypothetical protein
LLLGASPVYAASLPVYEVISRGVSAAQARLLARNLGLPNSMRRGTGELVFMSDAYQRVPTRRMGAGPADEDGNPTIVDQFDFSALGRITVLDDTRARNRAARAFRRAGLVTPSSSQISHSQFSAFDNAGRGIAAARLDTLVSYPLRLNGRPLVGPGAKARVAFDGAGRVLLLAYARRGLRRGPNVPLISTATADGIARSLYGAGCFGRRGLTSFRLTRRLVYYAPSLRRAGVRQIVPHYAYGGTAQSEPGVRVNLGQIVIPAIARRRLSVRLNATANGAVINGRMRIRGGSGPYSVRYSSCATPLNPLRTARGTRISYLVRAKVGQPTPTRDTLSAVVTDRNGLVAVARRTVRLTAPPPFLNPLATVAVGGSKDFSTEWIGSTQGIANGATNAADFADEMSDEGIWRFNFNDGNVWWTDFVDPAFNGQDTSYVDNVDLQWFEGHGNPDLFLTGQPSQISSYGYISVGYNNTRWGNSPGDLEWLALLGCNILQFKNANGVDLGNRWAKAYKGVHMLLGYATKSWDFEDVGNEFGDYIADEHKRITQAWAHSAQEQYSGTVYGYSGPIGPNNTTNQTDHVWGLGGGTTSDITSLTGYWVLYGQV